FINLHFKEDFLSENLQKIINSASMSGKTFYEDFGYSMPAGVAGKVMVEFVSANPTGPLHIGHGRGAAIGDSLARVLSYLGENVTKEYYLNDVGNQMQVLADSVKAAYLNEPLPEDGYKGEYIKDIALTLSGNAENIDFKAEAVNYILSGIKKDLEKFNITFDNWFSESKIALDKNADGKTEVDIVCEELEKIGDAYMLDGALWLKSTKYGDDKDRVLRRSDGRYTYLASDVAYHKNKYARGFKKVVNLWGADHHGYVARMKAAVQMLGQPLSSLGIILYQLVSLSRNGVPVAMSTRTGEFDALADVVTEVGVDACRFSFLLRSPESALEFDLDLAKKQTSENPVFYVQYVNARCNSIFKDAAKRTDFNKDVDLNILKELSERNLIKKLCFFGDTLELCKKTMSPHHLAIYLTELADAYHVFYENCRVLVEDANTFSARFKLLQGVSAVIEKGLSLLGVSAPKEM
ncbi:MAG: arginine--tRNA ligase, partial [Elusimicrobia bacterium]|nr:arginine--tRNA ligase [Elusimicrobiota bacterium]